jgi:hypothetical protein
VLEWEVTVAEIFDSPDIMSLTFTRLVLKFSPVIVTVVVVPVRAVVGLMLVIVDDSAATGTAIASSRIIAARQNIKIGCFKLSLRHPFINTPYAVTKGYIQFMEWRIN